MSLQIVQPRSQRFVALTPSRYHGLMIKHFELRGSNDFFLVKKAEDILFYF